MSKWDEINDELGNAMISDKTLTPIMLAAVPPPLLRSQIEDRIQTGRTSYNSDTHDRKQSRWRLNAKKNVQFMYRIIVKIPNILINSVRQE